MDDEQQSSNNKQPQPQPQQKNLLSNSSSGSSNLPSTTTSTQPSKLKMKNKLSPFAPAFDVSHSPTINPYSGQYGISTLPAQVPPAQISMHIPYINHSTNGSGNISNSSKHSTGSKKSAETRLRHDDELYRQKYHASNHEYGPNTNRSPIPGSHVQQFNAYHDHYYTNEGSRNHLSNASPPGYGSHHQQYPKDKHLTPNRIMYGVPQPNHHPHVGNGASRLYSNNTNHPRSANRQMHAQRRHRTARNGHMYEQRSPPVGSHNGQKKVAIQTYTKHRNAQPMGTTIPYKHPARHYGQPAASETDPKFTNPAEIASYQRWELLESAQRWLPGEGTFITWKKHRYLIGPPIHMGMNGHIHYCYKYPIPTQALKKMKQNNNSNEDEIEEEEDINKEDIEQPIVETLAAKIVPNTPAFAREIVILRALQKCENVTELYDVLESERTLISILELAQADVYNFFVGRGSIRHGWNLEKPAIREHFSKMVIKNVVQGLSQMHSNEYLHCDLKSLNILLYIYMTDHSNARGGVYIKAKLTDFGHSSHGCTRISEKLFSNGMARVGTAGHVAPELFVEGTKCTGMIDIWSLGIVMFSMLVPGRLLFGEYTDLPALKRAYDRLNTMNPWGRDGRDRPSWWTDFERLSPEARDLILWMTRYEAKDRPSCVQILEHPWFLLGHLKDNYRPKLEWVDRLCQSTIAQE